MALRTDSFSFPAVRTAIEFGFGVVNRLPEILGKLGVRNPLVVTDHGVIEAGVVEAVSKPLVDAGIRVQLFADVPQDSSADVVEQALGLLRSGDCDCVLGVGGGSSMDTAKCIAVRAVDDRPLLELAGLGKVVNEPLPVIAIPTTSGTGSEVSFWAVTRDDATNTKFSVGGELVFPKVALCDPELTIGLPPLLTATTGMDALTHAVESYTNKSHQPVSEALTLQAAELLGRNVVTATTNGADRDSRYAMMLGSTLAGLGMNPTRLGAVHALAMPLGSGHLRIPHGAANAVMLPHVTEFNLKAAPDAYARIARAIGVEGDYADAEALAVAGLERLREINTAIGIPAGMGDLGLAKDDISTVCEEAMKSGNIVVNPREISRQDLEDILGRAL